MTTIGLMPSDLSATISLEPDIRPYTLETENRIVPGTANISALGIK